MGLETTPQIGQPSTRKKYPFRQTVNWLGKNAWYWVRGDGSFRFTAGSDIDRWFDESVNNHHMRQNTAGNRPTVVTSNWKGLPAVEFNPGGGGTEFMFVNEAGLQMSATGEGDSGLDRTFIFCVLFLQGAEYDHGFQDCGVNQKAEAFTDRDNFSSPGTWAVRTNAAATSWDKLDDFPGTASPHIIAVTSKDVTSTRRLRYWSDGAVQYDKNGEAGGYSVNGTSVIRFGRTGIGTGDKYLSAQVFESVLFNRVLSDEKIIELTSYMNDRWKVGL